MNHRIIYYSLLTVLLTFTLACTQSHKKKVVLNFDWCFSPSAEAVQLPPQASLQEAYMQEMFLDSSAQFFSKMVILQQKDTLYLSVLQQKNLQQIQSLLTNQFSVIQHNQQTEQFSAQHYFGKHQDRYWLRSLFYKNRGQQGFHLIDMSSADSSTLRSFYKTNYLAKQIEPCF